jgi:thiamine biosynthesis lipoprotein
MFQKMNFQTNRKLIRHCYGDHLMATQFLLQIEASAEESQRIRSVGEEVFEEVRRLELSLSRFVEDSDISRINRLHAGESVIVSPETFQCLTTAVEMSRLTNGHFDIAYRSACPAGVKPFTLLTHPHRVQTQINGIHLDLGGIGKGFALDYGRQILLSYGYDRALLCSGTSTILALSPPLHSQGWEVVLDFPEKQQTLCLAHHAVSCSGKSVRGEHIFNPLTQSYATEFERIWVQAETAAIADALSTAFMTMNTEMFRRNIMPVECYTTPEGLNHLVRVDLITKGNLLKTYFLTGFTELTG